jgi:hypothetical protein
MATTKTKPTKPVPFTTQSPSAAYRHFLPIAKKLPADSIKPTTLDIDLARHNIERGISAIQPHLSLIKKKLPLSPLNDILELPALGLALVYAADRIPAPTASTGEIQDHLAKLRPLRELTLRQLEIHAELGLAPDDRVRAIRSGTGPLDAARDAVAIAGLYHELRGTLDGKHPFTKAQLTALADHGQWLLHQLKPTGATSSPAERDEASVVRDRFWTLIAARHEHLREAGVAAFGLRALDENVPPLGARERSRASTAGATPEAPAPAPA